MIILGITGPTGAGKSTVSKLFKAHGIHVIDTDITARKITEPGKPALRELYEHFGGEIMSEGRLNRGALAEIAFSDEKELAVLNRITHKYISEEVFSQIAAYDGEIIGIDGAVLFESGIAERCTRVLSVLADTEVRKERIMKRDGISEKNALLRISSQKNAKFYIEKSDYIVYNNNKEDLEKQISVIINDLRSMM